MEAPQQTTTMVANVKRVETVIPGALVQDPVAHERRGLARRPGVAPEDATGARVDRDRETGLLSVPVVAGRRNEALVEHAARDRR